MLSEGVGKSTTRKQALIHIMDLIKHFTPHHLSCCNRKLSRGGTMQQHDIILGHTYIPTKTAFFCFTAEFQNSPNDEVTSILHIFFLLSPILHQISVRSISQDNNKTRKMFDGVHKQHLLCVASWFFFVTSKKINVRVIIASL